MDGLIGVRLLMEKIKQLENWNNRGIYNVFW